MSYRNQVDDASFQFIAAVAVLIAALATFCGWSVINGGDVPIGYPYTITGTVLKEPTSRYTRSGESAEEKVALTIEMPKNPGGTLGAAWANGAIVVECLSTRCTQIAKGENHTLACRAEGRAFEPNVVECKHVAQNLSR